MKVSIDNLTVCGNLFGNLEELYANRQEVEGRGFGKFPYRNNVYFLDGSFLQEAEKDIVDSGKMKQLRYEFNPNKTEYGQLHMAVLGIMKDAHVTRADVAFDVYDVDMSRWKWIDSKGRPYRVYYGGLGEVETWYVGGKDSEVVIRIYNKAKEQKIKDKVWWRVEVQIRREIADLWASGQAYEFNPFKDVTPVIGGNFPELNIRQRALVNYLIEHPSGFAELSSSTRSEYRKTIRLLGSWECIDFYNVWQKNASLVQSEVGSWLNLTMKI